MQLRRVQTQPAFAMKIGPIDYEEIARLGKITVDSLNEALPELHKMYDDTVLLTTRVGEDKFREKELIFECRTFQTIEFPEFIEKNPEIKKDDFGVLSFFMFEKKHNPKLKRDKKDYSASATTSLEVYGISKERIIEKVKEILESKEIQSQRKEYKEQLALLKEDGLIESIKKLKQTWESIKPKMKYVKDENNNWKQKI